MPANLSSLHNYKSWRRSRKTLDAVLCVARLKVMTNCAAKSKTLSPQDEEAANLYHTIHQSTSGSDDQGLEFYEIVLYLQVWVHVYDKGLEFDDIVRASCLAARLFRKYFPYLKLTCLLLTFLLYYRSGCRIFSTSEIVRTGSLSLVQTASKHLVNCSRTRLIQMATVAFRKRSLSGATVFGRCTFERRKCTR